MTVWRAFRSRTSAFLRAAALVMLLLGMVPGQALTGVVAASLTYTAAQGGMASSTLSQAPLARMAPVSARAGSAPDQPFSLRMPAILYQRGDLFAVNAAAAYSAAAASLPLNAVSAGWGHVCALRLDGSLTCWGLNYSGQATPPEGIFASVSAGSYHTCALRADGTLACWGDNTYGQTAVPAGTYKQVSAGGYHTCAIRGDDSLACWGWNDFQQLTNIPTGSFKQVSAGTLHTCALRTDGSAVCWGWNADGQTATPAGGFTQVSAGGSHTCALRGDGSAVCWGGNLLGQASAPPGTYTKISAGSWHTCALRADDTLACWGSNGYGQLSGVPAGMFVQVSAGGQNTCALRGDRNLECWGWNRFGQSFPPTGVTISAGGEHTCALNPDGALVCWGENEDGQASPPAGRFTQVSAGKEHTCAVQAGGSLACWGDNSSGQASPPAGSFIEIGAGDKHTCAIRTGGPLACWGSNGAGQASAPTGVFTQLSAGGEHTCAIRPDGSTACWGSNAAGESTPPAGTFTQLSAGAKHTCGLLVTGRLVCWGDNSSGQSAAPGGMFAQVSAGRANTCAVRSDGTLTCWGDNASGQSNAPAGIYAQVSAGGDHACAVDLNGAVTCWGEDVQDRQLTLLPEDPNLSAALQDAPYTAGFSATGGTAPYHFTILAGDLPSGLALADDGTLSGTPSAAGAYDFTVSARDSSNPPITGMRAYHLPVTSTDTTPPVIEPEISGTPGLNGWYVSSVTVRWNVSDPESSVTAKSGCETTTLEKDTSGVTLTCTATSTGGTASRSVTIKLDATPPEVTGITADRAPDHNGWYNHTVTFTTRGTDATSGIATCTTGAYSGPDSAAASFSGTCTDYAGNISAAQVVKFQYDGTAPTLKPVVTPNPVYLNGKATVEPNAADATSGIDTVTCDKVDTSAVGPHSVSCTATDAAGNSASASAAYTVIYKFTGFMPPVENPPALNTLVAGQTVPLKWRLADASDKPVSGVSFVFNYVQVTCPAGVESAAATSPAQGKASAGDTNYHYNWKTPDSVAGTCKKGILDLGEGPGFEHTALFYFRK